MKSLLTLTFVLFLSTPLLFGQLEKGDIMFSLFGGMSINQNLSSISYTNNRITLRPNVGLMLNDQLMAGLGLSVQSTNSWNGDSPFLGSAFYTAVPQFRYYFKNKGGWLPYFEVRGEIINRSSDNEISKQYDGWTYRGYSELGVDFFIAPNIALEGVMGTRLFEANNPFENNITDEKIYMRFGIKTFLREKFTDRYAIKEQYLKAGNYILQGSGQFGLMNANRFSTYSFGSSSTHGIAKGFFIGLAPKVKYFKTQNWTVTGGVDLSLLTTEAGHRIRTGLTAGSGYYIPIKENLFFYPSIEVNYRRTAAKQKEWGEIILDTVLVVTGGDTVLVGPITSLIEASKASANAFQMPVSLSLVYFSKNNVIVTGGFGFLPMIEFHSVNETRTSLQSMGNVGFEYFFAPNISAKTNLSFSMNHNNNEVPENVFKLRPDSRRFEVTFGINYFIFNKNTD
ncbi:MAG: hypothetical protein AAFZ15_30270 [Bacteroidota bacterium]